MGGMSGGEGGMSNSSAASSGPATGTSGSGNKVFNFGVRPTSASSKLLETVSSPFVIAGAVAAVWLFTKKR